MQVKTSELTGAVLDWTVASCLGAIHESGFWDEIESSYYSRPTSYSTDWAQGGPILSDARISRTIDHSGLWIAYWTDGYTDGDEGKKWMQCDRSELVAGLRCYVASELGDEVEVPEELTKGTNNAL